MNLLSRLNVPRQEMKQLNDDRIVLLAELKADDNRLTQLKNISHRDNTVLLAGDFVCTLLMENGFQIFKCVIDKDGGMKPHTHDPSIEIFNLVKGSASIVVGGKEYKLKAPDSFIVPCGMEHSIQATKGSELVIILVPPEIAYCGEGL